MQEAKKIGKLTEAIVRDLPSADGRQYVVRDPELKGFLVVVGKKSKSWAVQRDLWRGSRGNRRLIRSVRYTIGRVGIVPLRVAREKALEAISLIQQGIDPNHQEPERILTLREGWSDYIAELHTKNRSPRTIADFEYCLRYFKDWLDLPLGEIGADRASVRKRHQDVTRKHGPYAANHAMRTFRAMYNHALRVDVSLPSNPVIAVTFHREERRDRVVTSAELPEWWQAIHALPNPIRRDFYLFLVLTGMRRSAAAAARWEHIDWKKRTLDVPNPKGGKKRAFQLPLSTFLTDMLASRKEENEIAYAGSPWVWPADSASGHLAEPKEPRRKLPPPHVLRHTYGSFAKAAGLNEADIALLLNHKLPGVTGGYIHGRAIIDHLSLCQERVTAHILRLLPETASQSASQQVHQTQ